MKKIRIISFISIIIFISIFLTGCFDKVELEDRALVLGIGIDKYEDTEDAENTEDTEKSFFVSLSMPLSNSSQNTEGGEENTEDAKTLKKGAGKTVFDALSVLDEKTSQNLYYGHLKVAILGEEVLKDESLLRETIDFLERNKEISRKIIILASSTKAEDILSTVPEEENIMGLYINNFYKNAKNRTYFSYKKSLEDIVKDFLANDGDTVIPAIESTEGDINYFGLCVLKDYQLAGYLSAEEVKPFLLLKDKNYLGTLTIDTEDIASSIEILKKNIKTSFNEDGGKIIYNVDLNINGEIFEYNNKNDTTEISKNYATLQEEYAKYLKQSMLDMLNKIKDIGADVIGLKEEIRKNNYDLYEKYNLQNTDIYNFLEFNVNCAVNIKGAGGIK